MNRQEFIKWLETTRFDRLNDNKDDCWRDLASSTDFVWDELHVLRDKVNFSWEEKAWGSTEYKDKDYTFDEFKEAYEKEELKN